MEPEDAILHSLLGAGTRYEGKLFFEGRVRIDGEFSGDVQSDGLLIIGPEAVVRGTIEVGTLIVHGGQVQAEIRAQELVELHAPARVRGDIHTKALFLDRGVQFEGACTMGEVLPLEEQAGAQSAEDTSPDGYRDQPTRS